MTPLLYRIGALCVRRRLLVVGAWLLLAVGLGDLDERARRNAGDRQRDAARHREPARARRRAARIRRGRRERVEPDRVPRAGGREADGRHPTRSRLGAVAAAYARDPGSSSAISPLTPAGAAQLSRDRRIGYIALTLRAGATELTRDQANQLFALAQQARIGRPAGRRRRLPRPGALQRLVGELGGDRAARRDRRAAADVRHCRRDGNADPHRDLRARHRAQHHRAAQPGGAGPEQRTCTRDDGRARRRDRLLAVRRHAPPRAALRGRRTARVDRAGDRDLRRRSRVRGRHGDDRALLAGARSASRS